MIQKKTNKKKTNKKQQSKSIPSTFVPVDASGQQFVDDVVAQEEADARMASPVLDAAVGQQKIRRRARGLLSFGKPQNKQKIEINHGQHSEVIEVISSSIVGQITEGVSKPIEMETCKFLVVH